MVPDFLLASFQYRAGSEGVLVKYFELVVGVIPMSILTIYMHKSSSIRILKMVTQKAPPEPLQFRCGATYLNQPGRG